MTDEKVRLVESDISFYTDTTGPQSFPKRDATCVVVVRMYCDGLDLTNEGLMLVVPDLRA